MEMSQMYDEDLFENQFFQQFCDMCPSLFQSAIENEWLICIPKVGTFETHELTEQDCLSHVLIQVSASQYKTASDKRVALEGRKIVLLDETEKVKQLQVLFSETFYSENQKRYQVWCIDQPISFDCSNVPTRAIPQNKAEFNIQNVDDAEVLLFTAQGSSLKRSLDRTISTYRTILGCSDVKTPLTLRYLIDTMHSLFTKCVQLSHKDNQLKKKLQINQHLESSVRLSVETYINHSLYGTLFKYICTVTAPDDAKLNKISRNLSQIQLKDLGITTEFSSNIPKARRELLNLSKFSTPLAKMACVKRMVQSLMQKPRSGKDAQPLTVDDLLPMLVFLIIRSSIPNWNANFEYMSQFHFSQSAMEEYSFYLSTLEAAMAYVKSGELKGLLFSRNEPKRIDLSSSPAHKTAATINKLFENIKCGDLEYVQNQLEQTGEQVKAAKLCHPLCSCDNCERNVSSGEISRVTVFSRDDRGYTALHQAALFNRTEIIEYLYQHGAVMNATDYHGSTPLHLACQRGHQGASMLLIFYQSDVNATDNDGNRPLHLAALNGHEECIKALLFQESMRMLDINAANENGDTALHLAAKWSYEYITKLLLEHGASPEARNRHKYTPMMLVSDGIIAGLLTKAIEAAQERANDGFIELVEPGTPDAATPVMSDISTLPVEQVEATPKRKISKKVKKLLKAVTDSDLEMVKHIMGWTETSYATSDSEEENYADLELCHPLCQCKKCAPTQKIRASMVDMNSSDEQGRTALHIAVEKSNLAIVTLLVQKRAEVNCKTDLIQFTPLHIACQQLNPNIKIMELLLESGAKVNCRDCNNRTPLHFSSQTGSLNATSLLLKVGLELYSVCYTLCIEAWENSQSESE